MGLRRTVDSVLPVLVSLWLVSGSLEAAQFHVTVGSPAAAGSKITIPIVATAEVTVGAAQLELLYDPQRLRWVDGAAGPLTASTLTDAHELTPGRVKIAFAGGEDVKATGVLYLATFEWIGTETTATPIRFDGVRAWDQGTGLELTGSSAASEVARALTAPDSRILIWIGAGVLTLILILAGIALTRRKPVAGMPS